LPPHLVGAQDATWVGRADQWDRLADRQPMRRSPPPIASGAVSAPLSVLRGLSVPFSSVLASNASVAIGRGDGLDRQQRALLVPGRDIGSAGCRPKKP